MSTLLTYIAQSRHIRPLRLVNFPGRYVNHIRAQRGECSPLRCVECPLFTGRRSCIAVIMSPDPGMDTHRERLRLLTIAERMKRIV